MPTVVKNKLVKNKLKLKSIYEIDEHLWLEETIKVLQSHRFNELDLDNLIEELKSLSRRDKNKVASLLEQVIIHLLLLEYWQEEYEYNANHWRGEILAFRGQLKRLYTTNLGHYLSNELGELYERSIKIASEKTKLNIKTFPQNCPYTLEQLLDENCLPPVKEI